MSQYFGKAVHTAFVVPDVEQAVNRMLACGIGPAYYMQGIRVPGRYRGERHDVLITAVFFYSGSLQYEFIQQHDNTPSAYKEFLARNREGGLHHVAYFTNTFESAIKNALAAGQSFDIVQEFIGEDGAPYEIYMEPANTDDPVLVQLMLPGPLEACFAEMEKAAAGWQGEKPIRNALDLLPPEMRPPVENVQVTPVKST